MADNKGEGQIIVSPQSQYQQLHNDFLYQLEIEGKRYKSVTHYIYAKMMPNQVMSNFTMLQIDGLTVRKKSNAILFGKKAKGDRKLPSASEYVIISALEEAYRARFRNKDFRTKLIGTGQEGLVYTRDHPTFLPGDITVLGLNNNQNGQNKLGLLLEQIRKEFQQEQEAKVQIIEVPEIDRLFQIIIRHQLLKEQLRLGHFPDNFSLESLFCSKERIPLIKFEDSFIDKYPSYMRISYYQLYQRWREPINEVLRKMTEAKLWVKQKQKEHDQKQKERNNHLEQLIKQLEGKQKKEFDRTTDNLKRAKKAHQDAIIYLQHDLKQEAKKEIDRQIIDDLDKAEMEYQNFVRDLQQSNLDKMLGYRDDPEKDLQKALNDLDKAEQAYQSLLTERKGLIPPIEQDLLSELEVGNTDWIEKAYDEALKEQAVLRVYLNYTKVDYTTLLLSIAKQKFIDLYQGQRFQFDKAGRASQITIAEYSKMTGATKDTLLYIGVEALTDLRTTVYEKYTRGELSAIPDLENKIGEVLDQLRHEVLGGDQIVFPRYVPKIKEPSKQFLSLISEDQVDPVSPRQTYGGIPLQEYYLLSSPEGACSDEVNAICPLGCCGFPKYSQKRSKYPIIKPQGGGADLSDIEEKDEGDMEDIEEGDFGKDIDEEEEERENNPDDGDDADGDGDFEEAIQIAKQGKEQKVPIQKYVPPVNLVKFGGPDDYPYEWMSPDYISMFTVDGLWYPSVFHYVSAKLATPLQFRNVPPRLWIQKDSKYTYKVEVDKNNRLIPDKMTTPKQFYSVEEIREALPERIQNIYNQLYVRYADRALNLKMKHYPFRSILFSSKPRKILYQDDAHQNAIAGKDIVTILTGIRDQINDIQELTVIPAPLYDQKKALGLYDFITERTSELIRATVIMYRQRLSPHDNYVNTDLPIIGFEDARLALQNFYPFCKDINYNEIIEDPSQKYRAKFNTLLTETIIAFFPKIVIFDATTEESKDAIRLKLEGKSEDPMKDKIFIFSEEIMNMIWIHVAYVCLYIQEDLRISIYDGTKSYRDTEQYNDDIFKGKLKDIRGSVFKMNLGTKEEVIIKAVLFLLKVAHSYFSESGLAFGDVQFVNDFILPGNTEPFKIQESESYNKYEELIKGINSIYRSPNQNLQYVKMLAGLVDNLIGFPMEDKTIFNKLTVRVKFFGAQYSV